MPFTARTNANIYWKHDGPDGAPALILLNSIGTDMDLWDAMLPYLRPHLQLLRIDTRGHGASDCAAGDIRLSDLAQDILAVADAAGLSQFAIAGVSLGGMIAMEAALTAPDRLTALFPICTSATMDSASWDNRVATVRRDGMAAIANLAMGRFLSDQAEPAITQAVRRQLLAMNAEGYAACGTAIRDMDLSHRIQNIATPTLVISGTRDTSTPYEGHADYLVATIPNAQHQALEAAHLAPLEAPEALAQSILQFMKAA